MVDKMFALKFCAILLCISTATCLPKKLKASCGYKSCHPTKAGFINVHIVPHTHDDVGWLKTVDQYYYGTMNYIQNAAVNNILDSVVESLSKNKDRRFIYVETSFLWKWWLEQPEDIKSKMRNYINSGQLEIIGGAWSMNDEATTHYQSIIDQFTWGLRILNDTFGECARPKIGWQIDPFGHSREMASLFAQLGFDGLLLGRIDYQDKTNRFFHKTPEFIWQGSQSLGNKAKLFTSVMYNTYSPPPGFCFDILCTDESIVDNRNSPAFNVDRKYHTLVDYVTHQRSYYPSDNVIITMGGDFTFMEAEPWFNNIDALISYGNEQQKNGSKYNLIYSTPSCYLKAVQDDMKNKKNWTIKYDDFFPYASDDNSYWTGYFTSRPTLKRFERLGNNFLQVCKQLATLSGVSTKFKPHITLLREAMGIMQHHDAVTGTEKQHVAYDYARILSDGIDKCQKAVSAALSVIVAGSEAKRHPNIHKPELNFESCLLANISECTLTESNKDFIVTVYNPLSRNVSHFVRIPVTENGYIVRDYAGNLLTVQVMPVPQSVLKIPGRKSNAINELVFLAKDVPPLGFLSFYVSETEENNKIKSRRPHNHKFGIKDQIQISYNPDSGKLASINIDGKSIRLTQDFSYYIGTVGDNSHAAARSSGAYIFRPNGSDATQISQKASFKVVEGPLVAELHQTFSQWASQVIRIFSEEDYIEFDWLVGPIPTDETGGKEVITKYTTSLNTNSTFYTDSNGREMLKRVRDYRPTWDLEVNEPVAGNYYPVTSKILIRDVNNGDEVAVLTDRAQGGSSLEDGELELMLHRTCIRDDAFGVGEELDESAFGERLVARGSHYIVAGNSRATDKGKTLAAKQRDVAQRKLLQAWTFVSTTQSLTFEDYRAQYKMRYSGLVKSLPDNVQILTLEPWRDTNFLLLRLEHVLEKNEDPNLSKPVTVNLKKLFSPFELIWYNETTLGANQWLQDNYRVKLENAKISLRKNKLESQENLSWNARGSIESNDIYTAFSKYHYSSEERDNLDFKITMGPMEIRTFIIEVSETISHI